MGDASNQLAKEIEWLRASMLAPAPQLPSARASWTRIADRVENVLRASTLGELLGILEQHNRNKKNPFLLGPYVFQTIASVEARTVKRKEMLALDRPPAKVRAHFKDASAKSKELAVLLRKGPQPHVALAGRRHKWDALSLVLSCQMLQGPGKSATIVSLDRLLDSAAASLSSVAESITRAKQHRRPAKGASEARSEELRSRATSILAEAFLKKLDRPPSPPCGNCR
jgi:hypothetical protein